MMEFFDPDGRLRISAYFGVDGKERDRWALDNTNRPIDLNSREVHAV
jgi:hypothetical protein